MDRLTAKLTGAARLIVGTCPVNAASGLSVRLGMKVHKVVLSIVDFDNVGADDVKIVLENTRYPNRCISPKVESLETMDIGEWTDEHPMNNSKTARAEFERLFA